MKHNSHHSTLKRLKRKYRHIAAAIAGAAIMSAMLPGLPAATAHAAANPNLDNSPKPVAQKIVKPHRVSKRINLKKTGQIETGQKETGQKETGQKETGQKETGQKETGQKDTGQKETGQKETGQKETGQKDTSGAPQDYKKVLDITATAYAPGAHDNDQWGDKTYLGTDIRPGVIAVDPNIIPLGSKVYIQYPDGHGEYAVAEDTGGAIKGHRIDIAMRSDTQAEKFGIQDVKVFVVSDKEKA